MTILRNLLTPHRDAIRDVSNFVNDTDIENATRETNSDINPRGHAALLVQ